MGLRRRIALFFALMGLAIPLCVGGSLWWAARVMPDLAIGDHAGLLVLAGGIASFALIGLVVGVWYLFDAKLAAPIAGLLRDVETALHANPEHVIDSDAGGYLGDLPDAVREAVRSLAEARRRTAREVAEATALAEETKDRLAAILNDLDDGVVICTPDHRILLYNQKALELLHVAGDLGLGRSLFTVVGREPFVHAAELLGNRLRAARPGGHPDGLATGFLCNTRDGRHTLRGRMRLMPGRDGKAVTGHLITLNDVSEELLTIGLRDHLLDHATNGMRRPATNLALAVQVLREHPDLDPETRARFNGIVWEEARRIADMVEELAAEYRDLVTGQWPMSDLHSPGLFACVIRRLREDRDIAGVMTGVPQWLHGDSHLLVELLDYVVHKVHEHTGADAFDFEAARGERRVYLDTVWEGEPIPSAILDSWLQDPLPGAYEGLTARDILVHHKTDLWSQRDDQGRARLRLPVALSRGGERPVDELPARPEFYDFDLLDRPARLDGLGGQRLRSLTFVVFDTETTGLSPSGGDEVVSLAAVRIVNGRVLTGESFNQLVNPGRPIPAASTRFHRITDAMVADMPPIRLVLPRFHAFVQGAVLVAHNAAFDMKFLRLREEEAGIALDNPVLDTLLLSVFLHDHTDRHGLSDVAERFGVAVENRHTAIGDALAAAAVFVRMVDLLEARGIHTLDDALAACDGIVEVKRQQARF